VRFDIIKGGWLIFFTKSDNYYSSRHAYDVCYIARAGARSFIVRIEEGINKHDFDEKGVNF
jgi:hypothetical protein